MRSYKSRIIAAAAAAALATVFSGISLPGGITVPQSITAEAASFSTGSRIRVDINKNDGRNASLAKNANNWVITDGASPSYKVGGVTFKLSNGGKTGGNVTGVNNKKLQLQSNVYPRLTMDGAKIKDGDNGGVLKLEISGLSNGSHSLQMWHCNVDGQTNSKLSISVNGKKVLTGVNCPTNVTNENDAGISYVTWSGSSVTILITPEGGGKQNVAWLNGFELDGSDPVNGVSRMYPEDQCAHLDASQGLSWTAGNELGTSDMQKMYVSGNVMTDIKGGYILKSTDNAWDKGKAISGKKNSTDKDVRSDKQFFEPYVNTQSAEDAYKAVIVRSGASVPKFDYIDSRYQKEVKNGTYTYKCSKSGLKGIIDSQKDAGGYPNNSNFKGGTAPKDTDRDGMPDTWETSHGLDPNNAKDGAIVSLSADDYTNLEMYLNELAGDPVEYNGSSTGKRGAVMDTSSKYEITNAATGALLDSKERWILKEGESGYYQIISAETGQNLSGSEQYKFVSEGNNTYTVYTKSSEDNDVLGGEGTKWKLTVKLDPITGKLIKSVDVLDTDYYASWSLDTSLDTGDTLFGDRAAEKCAVSELPARFKGAEVVLTSCDAKNSSKEQAKITAAENITLYVGLDSRLTNIPSWANDWTKESDSVKTSNDVTFNLYSKKLSAGESITLGANGQATGCMNYIVIASNSTDSKTEVICDVNMDGAFNVTDLVLVQKWLLGVPNTTLANWKAGDLCEDDVLDIFDLVMMRKALVGEESPDVTVTTTAEKIFELTTTTTTTTATTPIAERKFSFNVANNLFNQSNTDTLGLSAPAGAETVTVWKAADSGDHYCNGVCLAEYNGKLYCQWQSSATDEDSADTHVMYAVSSDSGKTWSAPQVLAKNIGNGYCTSGGWLATSDKLVAYINFWDNSLSVKGGYTYYMTSIDGTNWTSPQQVKMADGTPLNGIFEQDPHVLSTGRIVNAAHFQEGLVVCPIYTDDPSGISGWKKGNFTATPNGTQSVEMEPSIFVQSDGTLCMIFRDQKSSYTKLISYSLDDGVTWSKVQSTSMPDARTKQSAGNLSDGTAFMAGCPVNNKLRSPLAITISKDGKTFNKAYLLRSNSSDPALVYEGTAKREGFHYCKSLVANGNLYVGYATNKEAVEITIVPESSISLN